MIIDTINYIAFFVWGSFSFFVLLGVIAYFYHPKTSNKPCRFHRFVIVSIASVGVKKALEECISHTRKKFPKSRIDILIDAGSDMQLQLQSENINVVVVPAGYRQDLLGKGRAINYFIEKIVDPSFWYSFIDDDNLIMDNKFLYEIPEMESRGFVAMNPIIKARAGRSVVAHLMDSIRYFDDLTAFRFFTGMLGRPMMGLHGELLTVKGSVLKEIGFDHHSFTEDFRFAIELVRKNYRVWQSDTILSIKSPNTVTDLLKQRGRWFKGIIRDLRFAPFLVQLFVGWRTIVWSLGLFGSWLFAFAWLDFSQTGYIFAPGGLYFWIVYIWGIKEAKKWRYLGAIPLFGIIESGSFMFGLRHKKFEVINKN